MPAPTSLKSDPKEVELKSAEWDFSQVVQDATLWRGLMRWDHLKRNCNTRSACFFEVANNLSFKLLQKLTCANFIHLNGFDPEHTFRLMLALLLIIFCCAVGISLLSLCAS